MYIDEYISQHIEKLPEGQELMKFSSKCEYYIDHCKDLVPYDSPNYISEVFDMCIGLAKDDILGNKDLEDLCKYHDKYFLEK